MYRAGFDPPGGGTLRASASFPSCLDRIAGAEMKPFSPLCDNELSRAVGCDSELLVSPSSYYCYPKERPNRDPLLARSEKGIPVSFRPPGRKRAGSLVLEEIDGTVVSSLKFRNPKVDLTIGGIPITRNRSSSIESVDTQPSYTSRLPVKGSKTSTSSISPDDWSISDSTSTIDPLEPFFGCTMCGKPYHGLFPCTTVPDKSGTPLTSIPTRILDEEPPVTRVLETPEGQVMARHIQISLEELLTTLTKSLVSDQLGVPLKVAAGGAVSSLALQIASFFVTDNIASLVISAASLASNFMTLVSILLAMYRCKITEAESDQLTKLYTAYITKQANPPQAIDDLPPPPDYTGPQPHGFSWRGLVCVLAGLIVPVIAFATGLNVVTTLRDWFYADRGISSISKNTGDLWDTVAKFFVETKHEVYKKWHIRACSLRYALDCLQLKPIHEFILDVKEESKMDELLAEAESFHVTPYGFDTKEYPDFNNASLALVTAINEVKVLQREVRRVKSTASQKQVPVMILFIGEGGHGKSHLMHYMCQKLLEKNGYPPGIWHPSLAGNFMNYHGQYGAVIDELLPPTRGPGNVNSVMNLITSLVSQNPTNLEGAGLAEKNNPAQLKFIMAATNTELADFDQFTNAETAKAFFSKMLILRVCDPLYDPERGREDQPHRKPDYSHLQLSVLRYEMHTDRHKIGEPVSLQQVEDLVQKRHQLVQQEYLRALNAAIGVKAQNRLNSMGAFVVFLTGPTGVGKTRAIVEAEQDFTEATQMAPVYVKPANLPTPAKGFYVFDDYFDEDNIKNRAYLDQYVKFVNDLPVGSIVINVTNWKPKELSWYSYLRNLWVPGARHYPFHGECVARRFGLVGNFIFDGKIVTCGSLQNLELHMQEDGTILNYRANKAFPADDLYQNVVSAWMLYIRSCTRLRQVAIPRIDLQRKKEKMTLDIEICAPSMQELTKSVMSLNPLGKYIKVNCQLSQFTKAAACKQLLPRDGEALRDTVMRAISFLKVTASDPSIYFSVGDVVLLYDGATVYLQQEQEPVPEEEMYTLTYIPATKSILLRCGSQAVQSVTLREFITFRSMPSSCASLSPEWCHPDVVKQLNGLVHHFGTNYPSFPKDYKDALLDYHSSTTQMWWRVVTARFMEFIKNHPLYAVGGLIVGLITIITTGYSLYSLVKSLAGRKAVDQEKGETTIVGQTATTESKTVTASKKVTFLLPEEQKKRSTKERIATKAKQTISFSFNHKGKDFRWHPGKGSFISGDSGDPDWDRCPHDDRDPRDNYKLVEELRREWEKEDNMPSAIEELQAAHGELSRLREQGMQHSAEEEATEQEAPVTSSRVVEGQSIIGVQDAIQPIRSPIQHIVPVIENNMVLVKGFSPDGGTSFSARGIAVNTEFILCNAHLDAGGSFVIVEARNGEVTCTLHHKSVTRDLMMLKASKSLSNMKNLLNKFAHEDDIPAIYKGLTLRYLPDGQIIEMHGPVARRTLTRIVTALDGADALSTTGYAITKTAEGPNASINGDCGSPYISSEGNSLGKIFAIHIGLTPGVTQENEPTGVLVSRQDVQSLIDQTLTTLQHRKSIFDVANSMKKWVVPNSRETFSLLGTPEMLAKYYGWSDRPISPVIIPHHPNVLKVAGGEHWPPPKSPYLHTPFHDEMRELFEKLKLPLKDPVRVGFPHPDVPLDIKERPNPYQRTYATMARPPGTATKEFMVSVKNDLSAYFANLYKRPQILGEETVLSGGNVEEGVPFDALELDASAGHTANLLWGLTKMTDCFKNTNGRIEWLDTETAQKAKVLCDATLFYAEQGMRVLSIYKACVKMELKDTEKRDKPRIFFACDLHEKLFVRAVMGYYCAIAQARRLTHHAQVGISGGDDMWFIMNRLLEMSTHGWDEDIKSNDHTMPKIIYDVCFDLYKLRVSDPRMLSCLDVVCSMVSQPVHVFPGGMVQAKIGIPSGTPITAFLNSDAHFVLMYSCWKQRNAELHQDTNLSEFLKNVRPLFYADDGVTAVSSSVMEWWNFVEYARLAKQLFNVEITGSNKGAKIQRCIPVKDFEFVGRHFTLWGGIVYGSLRMQAITGRLLYTRDLDPTHVFCLVQEAVMELVLANRRDAAEAVLEIYRSKDPELASQIIILPPSVVPLYVHSRVLGGANKLTRKRLESLGFNLVSEVTEAQRKTQSSMFSVTGDIIRKVKIHAMETQMLKSDTVDALAQTLSQVTALVLEDLVAWPENPIYSFHDTKGECGCCHYVSRNPVDLRPLEVGLTVRLNNEENHSVVFDDIINAVSNPVMGRSTALKFRDQITYCQLELLARTRPHKLFTILFGTNQYNINVAKKRIHVGGTINSTFAWNYTWADFLDAIKNIPIPNNFHLVGNSSYPRPMQADKQDVSRSASKQGVTPMGASATATTSSGAIATAATPPVAVQPGIVSLDGIAAAPAMTDPVNVGSLGVPQEALHLAGGSNDLLSRICQWEELTRATISTTMQPGAPLFVGTYNPFDSKVSGQYVAKYASMHKRVLGPIEFRFIMQHVTGSGVQLRVGEFDITQLNETKSNMDALIQAYEPTIINAADISGITASLNFSINSLAAFERDSKPTRAWGVVLYAAPVTMFNPYSVSFSVEVRASPAMQFIQVLPMSEVTNSVIEEIKQVFPVDGYAYTDGRVHPHPHRLEATTHLTAHAPGTTDGSKVNVNPSIGNLNTIIKQLKFTTKANIKATEPTYADAKYQVLVIRGDIPQDVMEKMNSIWNKWSRDHPDWMKEPHSVNSLGAFVARVPAEDEWDVGNVGNSFSGGAQFLADLAESLSHIKYSSGTVSLPPGLKSDFEVPSTIFTRLSEHKDHPIKYSHDSTVMYVFQPSKNCINPWLTISTFNVVGMDTHPFASQTNYWIDAVDKTADYLAVAVSYTPELFPPQNALLRIGDAIPCGVGPQPTGTPTQPMTPIELNFLDICDKLTPDGYKMVITISSIGIGTNDVTFAYWKKAKGFYLQTSTVMKNWFKTFSLPLRQMEIRSISFVQEQAAITTTEAYNDDQIWEPRETASAFRFVAPPDNSNFVQKCMPFITLAGKKAPNPPQMFLANVAGAIGGGASALGSQMFQNAMMREQFQQQQAMMKYGWGQKLQMQQNAFNQQVRMRHMTQQQNLFNSPLANMQARSGLLPNLSHDIGLSQVNPNLQSSDEEEELPPTEAINPTMVSPISDEAK